MSPSPSRGRTVFVTGHTGFKGGWLSLWLAEASARVHRDDCELICLHTAAYVAGDEGALDAADPRLGISWPLPFTDNLERDRKHRRIAARVDGIRP